MKEGTSDGVMVSKLDQLTNMKDLFENINRDYILYFLWGGGESLCRGG